MPGSSLEHPSPALSLLVSAQERAARFFPSRSNLDRQDVPAETYIRIRKARAASPSLGEVELAYASHAQRMVGLDFIRSARRRAARECLATGLGSSIAEGETDDLLGSAIAPNADPFELVAAALDAEAEATRARVHLTLLKRGPARASLEKRLARLENFLADLRGSVAA